MDDRVEVLRKLLMEAATYSLKLSVFQASHPLLCNEKMIVVSVAHLLSAAATMHTASKEINEDGFLAMAKLAFGFSTKATELMRQEQEKHVGTAVTHEVDLLVREAFEKGERKE